MKGRIVVTEPMSTAFNFLEDIRERGYEPVVLESFIPEGYARDLMDEERRIKYSRIDHPVQIIKADADYEVSLRKVRALDPLLVIVGGEEGVILGTRLAEDLGMAGNSFSDIAKMTEKSIMHKALKDAGMRYIRGEEVSSCEDCLSFLKKTGTGDVVLKHVHGCASVGVHLVHGEKELLEAFEQERAAHNNMFGEAENRLMVQERIFGEEYIVNTISRNGIPALTSIFRYHKKRMPAGAIVYRGLEVVVEPDDKEKKLVEYAFQTVQTLGVRNGPVHGEYMIDEKGPVLIEANCRVMGGSTPSGFLDRVFGYHETGIVLDCMLDAEFHREFSKKANRPLRKGYVKDFYSAGEKTIKASGIVPIVLNMRSYYSGWVENAGRTDRIPETVDLETETGCVYLVHDDPEISQNDFDILMRLEEEYPDLLYTGKPLFLPPDNESDITPEVMDLLNRDPETLIFDILKYYKNGAKGKPIVPKELLEASPYNQGILEILKQIYDQRVK
jgi:hypothetical protein